MKKGMSEAAARVKAVDSSEAADGYDDYAPVFQKITADTGMSADRKLDEAIQKIVNETVGDIPQAKQQKAVNDASRGRKKHTGLKVVGLVLILTVAALATTYCVFAYQYRMKFINGTIINGIDASEKTVAEIESIIKQKVENYQLTLTFRGGRTETLSNADVGYEYVSSNGVQKIMDEQNTFQWFAGKVMGQTHEYTVSESTSYNQDMAKSSLMALPEFQSSNETAPENAYLTRESDSSFAIVQEEQGNTLKSDVVLSALDGVLASSAPTLDVSALEGAYETPTVTSDNQDLVSQKNALNDFLSTSITYQLP